MRRRIAHEQERKSWGIHRGSAEKQQPHENISGKVFSRGVKKEKVCKERETKEEVPTT